MNVTIKISDRLGQEARHRAVDAGTSLSGWVANLIQRELSKSMPKSGLSLLELIGDERTSDIEIEFPRSKSTIRPVDFS